MSKGLAIVGERVAALITESEAEAYARGRADARKELLDALGVAQSRPAQARPRQAKAAQKRAVRGSGRAPRGSVPRFVGRVLDEHPGTTAAEMARHAASDVERSIRLASIRVELIKGRAQGRYVSDNGRWSLAATEALLRAVRGVDVARFFAGREAGWRGGGGRRRRGQRRQGVRDGGRRRQGDPPPELVRSVSTATNHPGPALGSGEDVIHEPHSGDAYSSV